MVSLVRYKTWYLISIYNSIYILISIICFLWGKEAGEKTCIHFSSRSGLWLWMTFIAWTFSLFIKNHVMVNVQVFSQVVVFSSQGCLIVYLQILDIRSCMQVFFPCFLPPKKTYDVYQNIYWIIYWNQISGLVTHQAHHAQGCLSSKYWKPIMIFNVEISYQVLQHITLIPPSPP